MLKLIFFGFFFIPLMLNYWIMCNMIAMLTFMFILIYMTIFL